MDMEIDNNLNINLFFEENNNLLILKEYSGKIQNTGKDAKLQIEKNKHWIVKNIENSNEFVILHCNKNFFSYIDIDTIDIINKFSTSWYVDIQGYVTTNLTKHSNPLDNFKINGKSSPIHLHAILMNHFGYGRGQESVDHINRNKLDNRLCNLRLATQSEQNQNTDKRNRKYNARSLPDGIEHKDLPKYVVYYVDFEKDKDGNQIMKRDFFKIEKHPKLDKPWTSTKSKKISILDKLEEAKNKIEELNILFS